MNLFVGNLSPVTTENNLLPLFSEFGEVVSIKVILDIATGTSRGFGFVEMADKSAGFDAIDNLDGVFLLGNVISVKEAKQSNTRNTNTFNKRPSTGPANRTFKPRIPPRPREGGYNNF